jgi:hypothetical protein
VSELTLLLFFFTFLFKSLYWMPFNASKRDVRAPSLNEYPGVHLSLLISWHKKRLMNAPLTGGDRSQLADIDRTG